jgi:hypothetical protein
MRGCELFTVYRPFLLTRKHRAEIVKIASEAGSGILNSQRKFPADNHNKTEG